MVSERAGSALLERTTESGSTFSAETGTKSRFSVSNATKTRLKILLSVLMVVALFAFGKVDLSKSLEIVAHSNPLYMVLACFLMLSPMVLNAYRWQKLAAAIGFERPLAALTQYCFVGAFFNLFLPSTVGGDFSRCYYLSKGTGRYHHALYSVLADRVIGIAVLFAFAACGILCGPSSIQLPLQLKLPIFAGAIAIFLGIPFMPLLTRKILGENNKIAQRFNNSVVHTYWREPGLIAVSLALSVVMQLVMILCHIAVGYALGLTDIPIWYYFILYPSVAVLGFVTPSFNGVGIREWAYTYFITSAGVDKAHALSYAVIWLGLNTALSLVGGLVYLLGHLKIDKKEAEKMQSEPA